jgi:hypothetical protein
MAVRRAAPLELAVFGRYCDDRHETAALSDRLREKTDPAANSVREAIRRVVHAVDSGVDRWKGPRERTTRSATSSTRCRRRPTGLRPSFRRSTRV